VPGEALVKFCNRQVLKMKLGLEEETKSNVADLKLLLLLLRVPVRLS
jgi:hypothetical protein